ncbi:MAG: cytochrome c oxidase subunit I, partial [Gemmatimonadota bacterium]
AVQLIFFFTLVWSRLRGARAPDNPWEATSLEWSVPSPPPFDNFGGHPPVVNHGPNEYGVKGAADYVMQTAPDAPAGT